jgi:hypothetical protein
VLLLLSVQAFAYTEFFEAECKENQGNGTLFFDSSCSGGGGVKGRVNYKLTHIDIPAQHRSEAKVFVRMKTEQKGYLAAVTIDKRKLTFYTPLPKPFEDWQWVELKPYHDRVPDAPLYVASGGKGKDGYTYVDAYIITTEKNFDPAKYYKEHQEKLKAGDLNKTVIKVFDTLETRPQAFAALTAKAPIIDGNLDDECWKNAVRMDNFTLLNSDPAKEQTEFYLCHDQKNLYIAVKAHCSILDPVLNSLDAFKQETKKRDGKVFADDSVEVFLSPDIKGDVYYQFAANVHTFYDAKKFDAKWNSNAVVKGKTHMISKGGAYYAVEMAIPLADIGVVYKPEAKLYINVCRNERAKNELSSWAIMTATGFHVPERFGALLLGDGAFPGNTVGLKEVSRGEIALDYQLQKGSYADLSVAVRTINGDGKVTYKNGAINEQGQFVFATEAEGFQYSVGIFNQDQLLYKTVEHTYGVTSQKVLLVGSSEKEFTVYLNGRQLGKSGKQLHLESGLIEGVNVVAVKAEAPVYLEIKSGDAGIYSDQSWKFNTQEVKDWNVPAFNDISWKHAAAFIENNQSYMGEKSGTSYLRKTIIKNTTRVFPKVHRTLHPFSACKNIANNLSFVLEGVKAFANIRDYKIYLELPEEIEFLGASGKSWWRYGVNVGGKMEWRPRSVNYRNFKVSKAGTVINEGVKYIRYELQRLGTQVYSANPVRYNLLSCAIRPKKNAPANLKAYYYMSGEGNNIQEMKNTLYIDVLPEPKSSAPKRMTTLIWYLESILNDPKLSRLYLEAFKQVGINLITPLGRPETFRILDDLGVKSMAWYWLLSWSAFNGQPITSKYPYAKHVNSKGVVSDVMVPIYHLVHDKNVQAEYRKLIDTYLKEFKPYIFQWDVEFCWGGDGAYVSWDKYTIEDFKKVCKIGGDLTPEIIRKKHAAQWHEYMCTLAVENMKIIAEVCKQNNVKFMVYSGWPGEATKSKYGVDWERVAKVVDLAMCGYAMPAGGPELLKKYSGRNIPVVSGYLISPCDIQADDFSKQASKADLLTRVAYTPDGYHVYASSVLTAQGITAIAEFNRMLVEYEDIILDGKRVDDTVKILSKTKKDDVFVYEHENKKLIFVRNLARVTKSVKLANIGGGYSKASEFYTGKTFRADDIVVEIHPGDIAAILLGK